MRLFAGKKVVLVGPAPHILERKQDFSDFDLVVRTNTAIAMLPGLVEATGPRCDVLYLAVLKPWMRTKAPAMDAVKQFRVKNSQLWHPDNKICDVLLPWRTKVRMIDSELEHLLTWEVGCDPNVGLVAMVDILSENPQELYVTGFTFFQGVAHFSGYRNAVFTKTMTDLKGETPLHRQKPQFDFFLREVRPYISVDPELQQLCEKGLPDV